MIYDDLSATQKFEIEIDGFRSAVSRAEFFAALSRGDVGPSDRIWIGGYEGRRDDLDERKIDGRTYMFLKNTPLEKKIVDRFRGLERWEEEPARKIDPPKEITVKSESTKTPPSAPTASGGSVYTPQNAQYSRPNDDKRAIDRAASEYEPFTPIKTFDEPVETTIGRRPATPQPRSPQQTPQPQSRAPWRQTPQQTPQPQSRAPWRQAPQQTPPPQSRAPWRQTPQQSAPSQTPAASNQVSQVDTEWRRVFIAMGLAIIALAFVAILSFPGAKRDKSDTADVPPAKTVELAFDSDENDWETASDESSMDESGMDESSEEFEAEEPQIRDSFPQEYSTRPFASKNGRVPNGTRGNDVAVLGKALTDALYVRRSLYSTVEEYGRLMDKRRKELQKKGLDGMKMGDKVFICLPPKSACGDVEESEYVTTDYNVRTRTLTLKGRSSVEGINEFVMRLGSGFDLCFYSGTKQKSDRLQKNFEYGVVYKAALPTAEHVAAMKADQPQIFDVVEIWNLENVEPSFVEEYSQYLSVCCVGRLTLPDRNLAQQLVAARYEGILEKETYAVLLDDVEFWIYDYRDGNVFAKFSANDVRRGVAKGIGDDALAQESSDSQTEKVEWSTILDMSKDVVEKWEAAPPDIIVPEDAPTLVEALERAEDGYVVQIAASKKPVTFGVCAGWKNATYLLTKKVSIVGETGNPADAVVVFDSDQCLYISDDICVKGVTFLRTNEKRQTEHKPLVRTSIYECTFKSCVFDGGGVEGSLGVSTGSNANFWKCSFRRCRQAGVLIESDYKNRNCRLEYCEFGPDNSDGVRTIRESRFNIIRSRFYQNARAFVAEDQSKGILRECLFESNARPTTILPTCWNAVKTYCDFMY